MSRQSDDKRMQDWRNAKGDVSFEKTTEAAASTTPERFDSVVSNGTERVRRASREAFLSAKGIVR